MGKAPAFQFYIRDWLSDPELQSASAATRGIWINALCYMWESRERGKLEGTIQSLSRLLNCSEEEFSQFLRESKIYNFDDLVTHDNGKVTLVNRRMQRDEKERNLHRNRQDRYRQRHKGHVNDAESDSKVTAPSSSSSSSSIKNITQFFDKFWDLYPSRNGHKVTKKESFQFFNDHFKSEEEISLLLKATENYSRSCKEGFAKDPIRFLKKDFWKDWIEKGATKSW